VLEQYEANGQQVEKISDAVVYNSIISELKALTGRYPGIEVPSIQEKQMIIKAMQSKPGSCTSAAVDISTTLVTVVGQWRKGSVLNVMQLLEVKDTVCVKIISMHLNGWFTV